MMKSAFSFVEFEMLVQDQYLQKNILSVIFLSFITSLFRKSEFTFVSPVNTFPMLQVFFDMIFKNIKSNNIISKNTKNI